MQISLLYVQNFQAIKHFNAADNINIKIEIINALASFADLKYHGFLIDKLFNETQAVKVQIVKALKTCGRLSAVEQLYLLNKKTIGSKLKSRINEAIAHIQSRLAKGESGLLSSPDIIYDTDGALSNPVSDEDGRLSLDIKFFLDLFNCFVNIIYNIIFKNNPIYIDILPFYAIIIAYL